MASELRKVPAAQHSDSPTGGAQKHLEGWSARWGRMRESRGLLNTVVKQWPQSDSLGSLSQKFASDDDEAAAAAEPKEESQKMNIQVQCQVVEGS